MGLMRNFYEFIDFRPIKFWYKLQFGNFGEKLLKAKPLKQMFQGFYF